MIQYAPAADWHGAVIFNARIANDPSQQEMAQDAAWDDFDISLLPKASASTVFNMLRPVAVSKASAKLWSRCMFHALQKYDAERSPSHMGFRKKNSRPELVATLRLVSGRRMEWG